MLSQACDDLEDVGKRSDYGKALSLRHGVLDTSMLRIGEYYELCWRMIPPDPATQGDITPYQPRYGATNVQIFVKVPVLDIFVAEMGVTTATVKLITNAPVETHCKALLRGGDEIFVIEPFQIRRYGAVGTWEEVA